MCSTENYRFIADLLGTHVPGQQLSSTKRRPPHSADILHKVSSVPHSNEAIDWLLAFAQNSILRSFRPVSNHCDASHMLVKSLIDSYHVIP